MKIKHFLQLIRYKNLLMLIFMMVLFKYKFFWEFLKFTNFSINLDTFLLLISIIFITASGNIINDIFDVEVDLINKPNKVIIDKYISKKRAFHLYYIINFVGIIFSIYLCYSLNKLNLSLIFIATSILLFIYSKYLKKRALLGNFIVSVLIAISILLIYVFSQAGVTGQNNAILYYFLCYAFFAFILNFIREIVKDIEDIDGDYSQNMKTLPIVIGRKRTQNVVLALALIPLLLSVYFAFGYFNQFTISLYILFFTILPLVYFIYKINDIKSKKEFHKLSTLLKLIMFFGMLSVLFIKI